MNKTLLKNKGGFTNQLVGLVIGLVIVGVIIGLGFLILAQTQTAVGNASSTVSNAYNQTGNVITAMNTIPTWLPILVLVAIAGLVIMYIMGWAGGMGGRKG